MNKEIDIKQLQKENQKLAQEHEKQVDMVELLINMFELLGTSPRKILEGDYSTRPVSSAQRVTILKKIEYMKKRLYRMDN